MTWAGTSHRMPIAMRRDEHGDLVVTGVASDSPLLTLLEDDLDHDLDRVEQALAAIGSISAGLASRYEQAYDMTRLSIEPTGAQLRPAFRASTTTVHDLDVDELREALVVLRDLLVAEHGAS